MTERLHSRNTVAAAAFRTQKPTCEDASLVTFHESGCAVAIADGVGSSRDAHVASMLVVERFMHRIRRDFLKSSCKDSKIIDLAWSDAGAALHEYYDSQDHLYKSAKGAVLQTTLITLVESHNEYHLRYIGNGSTWLLRGDFWEFPAHIWPWAMCDLLVGHAYLNEAGRDELYGVLSPFGISASARSVRVSKDLERGEIFLMMTDGISSPDHQKTGRDPSGKMWGEINPHLAALVQGHLPSLMKSLIAEDAARRPAHAKAALDEFLEQQKFEDDATIALVVSARSIEYYREKLTHARHS
jgi:serine/threonine protein phosphatase PrpC